MLALGCGGMWRQGDWIPQAYWDSMGYLSSGIALDTSKVDLGRNPDLDIIWKEIEVDSLTHMKTQIDLDFSFLRLPLSPLANILLQGLKM